MPITEGQLKRKRETFWETAPAYEGRCEIWDALKAACEAVEEGDYTLAQAIIDGANINLPTGEWLPPPCRETIMSLYNCDYARYRDNRR